MSDQSPDTPRAAATQFCTSCGAPTAFAAAFCQTCGTPVSQPALASSQTPTLPIPDAGGMDGVQPLTLKQAWVRYAVALGVVYAVGWGLIKTMLIGSAVMTVLFVVIPILGIYMTRSVMRRLIEWHPNYSTLQNVAGAKLGMVFLWPLQMLNLLFKLTVNRVL